MQSVSIIIPTYNGRSLLHQHLSDVVKAAHTHDEIIIVDDASSDNSVEWLRKEYELVPYETRIDDTLCYRGTYKDVVIKVLVNQSNQRFASSCNRGVLSAKSEIIVLLNNDVSPEKDFLPPLLPYFSDQSIFAVGCKELSSNGVVSGKAQAHFERGFYVHNRDHEQKTGITAWVAGGSGAFRRSMWLMLGGFDLDFKPAYGEDIDLSYRAQMRGWQTWFESKSVVHHVHESTNDSVFGQQRIEIMSFKNDFLFMWKNTRGKILLSHFAWLPYHFVFTTLRSNGRFLQGFIRALRDFFL